MQVEGDLDALLEDAKKAQEIAEGIAMAEAAKEMHTMLNKKKF